jgi:hypothetical protein
MILPNKYIFASVFPFSYPSLFFYLGNYSVYGLEIVISRHLIPFILSVYLPTAMFVVMSWVRYFSNTVNLRLF